MHNKVNRKSRKIAHHIKKMTGEKMYSYMITLRDADTASKSISIHSIFCKIEEYMANTQ